MLAFASFVAMAMLGAAILLAGYRLVRGPSLPDRVVALDLIGMLTLGMVAISAVRAGDPVVLDVAIAVGLLNFMGTVAFARYVERSAKL